MIQGLVLEHVVFTYFEASPGIHVLYLKGCCGYILGSSGELISQLISYLYLHKYQAPTEVLFLCCSFFGVAFVEILDFLIFVFWPSGSFRLKKASNRLIFHLFFRVLRFFLFSVIFVLFVFRRRLR